MNADEQPPATGNRPEACTKGGEVAGGLCWCAGSRRHVLAMLSMGRQTHQIKLVFQQLLIVGAHV